VCEATCENKSNVLQHAKINLMCGNMRKQIQCAATCENKFNVWQHAKTNPMCCNMRKISKCDATCEKYPNAMQHKNLVFKISRMLASAPAAGGELQCELLVTAEGVRLCHATTGGVKPGPSRQGASCPATSRRAATCPPFFHIFYSVVDFIVLSVKSHFLFFLES
jgi:hypothetical protein